jgi:predicted metalloprotease
MRGGGFGLPGGGIRIPVGGSRGGIGSLIGIVVVLGIIWVATGVNPIDMLSGGGSTTSVSTSSQSRPLPQAGQDQLADFVGVVVKETETLWTGVFRQNNLTYDPPTVVLFSEATQSGCGIAQSASGPFYCPIDKKVYIDLTFYDQLRDQFGAPGDFAQAYVIAHEIGHAVQDQTRGLGEGAISNEESVKIELQADCYAGVWANYAGQENLLESGDFEEAMNAANQIGDDVLTRGRVSPREFTHGTAQQRRTWFNRGYRTGDPGQCDTFARGAI